MSDFDCNIVNFKIFICNPLNMIVLFFFNMIVLIISRVCIYTIKPYFENASDPNLILTTKFLKIMEYIIHFDSVFYLR